MGLPSHFQYELCRYGYVIVAKRGYLVKLVFEIGVCTHHEDLKYFEQTGRRSVVASGITELQITILSVGATVGLSSLDSKALKDCPC